jgi:hypothetical protein
LQNHQVQIATAQEKHLRFTRNALVSRNDEIIFRLVRCFV